MRFYGQVIHFINGHIILEILCIFIITIGYNNVHCAPSENNLESHEQDSNQVQRQDANKPYEPTKEERKFEKRRRRLKERWEVDIDGFLEHYGYMKKIWIPAGSRKLAVHSDIERKRAISLFQEFFNLKATGKLNKRTIKIMKEPRCGLPDTGIDDPFTTLRHFYFYRYYPRWRRSILTWRASKYTKKISPLGLWKTIKKAFETWSSVSGIRFLYTRANPDIQISFEHGNHDDGRSIAFDDKGGQVAHAFGPGEYTISGDVHLDDNEDWTQSVNPKDGMNLLAVTIHELGHSLGLYHSKNPRSVMYPAFVSTNLDLSIEDIENIQRWYGPNPKMKDDLNLLAEPTTAAPKICKIAMDDMELGPDGYTYIFKKSNIQQIDKRGKLVKTKDKVNIWDVYKNGPPQIDAAAYLVERKKTYLFYNKTLWRYTNFDLDYGYPKNITDMPETPRCGAFIRDQYGITRLLLFGVEQFWELSTGRDRVMNGYPLSTSQYFEGMPKSPTGAIRWTDGYIYFFKRDKVYKVHPGTYKVMVGHPKPMPPDWMKDIC